MKKKPSAAQIKLAHQLKAARINFGCSQSVAAAICGVTTRAWQRWEAVERNIPYAALRLFLIRTHQDEIYGIKKGVDPEITKLIMKKISD